MIISMFLYQRIGVYGSKTVDSNLTASLSVLANEFHSYEFEMKRTEKFSNVHALSESTLASFSPDATNPVPGLSWRFLYNAPIPQSRPPFLSPTRNVIDQTTELQPR